MISGLSVTVFVAELTGTQMRSFHQFLTDVYKVQSEMRVCLGNQKREFQRKLSVSELIISVHKNGINSYLRNNTNRIDHFLTIMISFSKVNTDSKIRL